MDLTGRGLEGRRAIRLSRDTVEPLSRNERTLREHYRRKQARYEVDLDRSYDRRLLRVFGRRDDHPRGLAASRFLREIRPQLRRLLTRRARMHPYLVNHVLRTATQRARLLDLKLKGSQRRAKRDVLAMLERIMLDMDTGALHAAFSEFYRNEPCVRVLPSGQFPNVRNVRGSNFCDIGVHADGRTGRAVIVTAIDNLVKGASGQAVQNMNLMAGFDETMGLKFAGLCP